MIGVKRCVNVSITVAAVKFLRIDKPFSVSGSAVDSLYCVCYDTVLIRKSEIKETVHATLIIFRIDTVIIPRLSDQICILFFGFHHIVKPGQDCNIFIICTRIKFLYCIQTETVHAEIQPELHDLLKLCFQCFIIPVQIRHLAPELSLIIPVSSFHRIITAQFFFGKIIIIYIRAL